jgi:hypothetical protein
MYTVRPDLFHVNGRTDKLTDNRQLIVTFRKFANAPKTTNFALHHSLFGFYNGDEKCLLRGTN